MSVTERPAPPVEFVWPHIWDRDGRLYRCRTCLTQVTQPMTFGCPGRQGRPAPIDSTPQGKGE